MITITCKNNVPFSACNENFVDAEWILQEYYYKAQGCIIITQDECNFKECTCDHCVTLKHDFEELIDRIKEDND